VYHSDGKNNRKQETNKGKALGDIAQVLVPRQIQVSCHLEKYQESVRDCANHLPEDYDYKYRQRVPVPISMWRPFATDGARAHWFDTGIFTVQGRPVAGG
jgi:hypothetical protein